MLPRGVNGTAVESGPAIRVPLVAGKYLGRNPDPKNCCSWEIARPPAPRRHLRPGQRGKRRRPARRHPRRGIAHSRPLTEERAPRDRGRRLPPRIHRARRLPRCASASAPACSPCSAAPPCSSCSPAPTSPDCCSPAPPPASARWPFAPPSVHRAPAWSATGSPKAPSSPLPAGATGLLLARACLPLISGALPALRDLGTLLVPVSLDATLDVRVFLFTLALCCCRRPPRRTRPRLARRARQPQRFAQVRRPRSAPRPLAHPAHHRAGRHRHARPRRLRRCSSPPSIASPPPPPDSTPNASSPSRWTRPSPNTPAIRTRALAERLERDARSIPGRRPRRHRLAQPDARLGPEDRRRHARPARPPRPERQHQRRLPRLVRHHGDEDRRRPQSHPEPTAPSDAPIRVVVNQTFARRFFPNESPLGRKFGVGRDQIARASYEIVGVVTDARYRSFREPIQPTLFSCECGPRGGDAVLPTAKSAPSARRRPSSLAWSE